MSGTKSAELLGAHFGDLIAEHKDCVAAVPADFRPTLTAGCTLQVPKRPVVVVGVTAVRQCGAMKGRVEGIVQNDLRGRPTAFSCPLEVLFEVLSVTIFRIRKGEAHMVGADAMRNSLVAH